MKSFKLFKSFFLCRESTGDVKIYERHFHSRLSFVDMIYNIIKFDNNSRNTKRVWWQNRKKFDIQKIFLINLCVSSY